MSKQPLNLTSDPIGYLFVKIAIPSSVGTVFMTLYNIVDTFIRKVEKTPLHAFFWEVLETFFCSFFPLKVCFIVFFVMWATPGTPPDLKKPLKSLSSCSSILSMRFPRDCGLYPREKKKSMKN